MRFGASVPVGYLNRPGQVTARLELGPCGSANPLSAGAANACFSSSCAAHTIPSVMECASDTGSHQPLGKHISPWYAVPMRSIVCVEHPFIIKDVDKGLKTFGNAKRIEQVGCTITLLARTVFPKSRILLIS